MEMFGFVLLGVVSPLLRAISNDSILENGSRCQKTIFEKNKKTVTSVTTANVSNDLHK